MTILTPRQLQVLQLTADGLTRDQIAARLFLSTSSVRVYKTQLFERLGVNSSPHAVSVAYQRGLLRVASDAQLVDPQEVAFLRSAREMGYRIALERIEAP